MLNVELGDVVVHYSDSISELEPICTIESPDLTIQLFSEQLYFKIFVIYEKEWTKIEQEFKCRNQLEMNSIIQEILNRWN